MEAPPTVKFSALKGILFDIDGTLANSDPLHFKAFQDILAEVGYNGGQPIDEHFFRKHISGRHNPEIAKDLLPHWPEDKRTQFYEDKEAKFRDMAGAGALDRLPGLSEFLAWLDSRKLRKAAVTNAPKLNTVLMLKALELDTYFEAVVFGEDCARAKPHPDPYLEGLRLLSLKPEDALVFEDSPSGIRAAIAAGIQVIALTTGQSEEALRAAGARIICRDFHDVIKMIHEEEGRG